MDDLDRLVIDHARSTLQTSMGEIDVLAGKSARLVNLGVATLGGAIAAAGLLTDGGATFDSVTFILGGGAFLMLAAALAVFVLAFVGLGRRFQKATGPELDDLIQRFESTDGDARGFLGAYLTALADAFKSNRAAVRRVAVRQGRGIGLLGGGLLVLFGALAYVFGGAILE